MATCAGCPAELPPDKINPLTGVVARQRKWCSRACRQRQYSGRCVDCGKPTDGSNGRAKAPERCAKCRAEWQHEQAVWTRERLIAEARRWHALTGAWPTATHWHSTCGGHPGEAFGAAVLEFRALTGPWPESSAGSHVFGSWAAFIVAAGGEAPGTCAGVKNGQRAAEMRAALAALDGQQP